MRNPSNSTAARVEGRGGRVSPPAVEDPVSSSPLSHSSSLTSSPVTPHEEEEKKPRPVRRLGDPADTTPHEEEEGNEEGQRAEGCVDMGRLLSDHAELAPKLRSLAADLDCRLSEYRLAEQQVERLLARRKEALENRKLVEEARHPERVKEVVRLNVGGEVFVVPVNTLLGRESNTFFHALLGAKDEGVAPVFTDADGAIFIDRDPGTFRHILNYFRGYSHFQMLEEEQLRKLKVDARYFQLPGLLEMIGESEQAADLQFQPGPGVSPERNRLRVVYGVAVVGDIFLVTGRHRITFEIKVADYVGVGLVSEACVSTDQEFHKTANCCVYYMSGVFYTNFPHHRKEENLEKIENGDFVSVTVDMDKGVAEFTLRNSIKTISIGRARRLRFAVTMKMASRIRIVPEDEASQLPMHQKCSEESPGAVAVVNRPPQATAAPA